MPPRLPFWSTLLRNRRGSACTVCACLLYAVVLMFGTWSARCFLDKRLYDFPGGTVPILAAFMGAKVWQYREDANAPDGGPPRGPTPTP